MTASKDFEPRFSATAIGSFPHREPKEALELVFEFLDEAPLWPQLPRIDWLEGMSAQYIEGLPGARLDAEKQRITLDIEEATFALEQLEQDFDAGDTSKYSISKEYSRGLHLFCDALRDRPAPPLVKGHVTGPVTLALSLETNFEDRPAIYEPELARMIARLLGLKARYQEELFAQVAPEAETLIFLDEPSMGSIGSAVLNLDADLAVELLRISASACRGLPGVHCCGETDLGLIAEAGIRVLNFDAYEYLDSVAAAGPRVRSFVEEGGMLAIGVVPSSLPYPEAIEKENLESLWARLLTVVETLTQTGLDRELLARRSFITPSCGTGGMTLENSRRSLTLTRQLSDRAREHFLK